MNRATPKDQLIADERIAPGGLMRCCWPESLSEHFEKGPPWNDGDVVPCKYCSSSMIREHGVWRWNKEEG